MPQILLLIALLLTACVAQPTTLESTVPNTEPAKLVRVIDGDTIVVIVNNAEESVRLIGIDATEAGECGAAEATIALAQLLKGQPLTLHSNPEGGNRDKYNRLLRYVHTPDDDVGMKLLKEGYVHNFPWYPHPRQEEYTLVNDAAKKQGGRVWEC